MKDFFPKPSSINRIIPLSCGNKPFNKLAKELYKKFGYDPEDYFKI
jgi:hypothetical protein